MTEPVLGRPNATPSDQIGTFRVEGPTDLVHSSELTALCPVTDQPDFYTIDIEYVPGSCCIETKSPNLYLRTFDNRGVFAEHLAKQLEDLCVATLLHVLEAVEWEEQEEVVAVAAQPCARGTW